MSRKRVCVSTKFELRVVKDEDTQYGSFPEKNRGFVRRLLAVIPIIGTFME